MFKLAKFIFIAASLAVGSVLSIPIFADAAGPNLIENPSFEQSSAYKNPAGWRRGGWGNNKASFTYPNGGRSGYRSAELAVYQHTNGDAKWYFKDVSVTPGYKYIFSNYYQSNAPTTVTARFTRTDGSYEYEWLGSLDAAPVGWTNFTATFTVPAGVKSVTVFHLLDRVGWLQTDDYSLMRTDDSIPQPSQGMGMVTLAFDDGWEIVYQNALPILNAAGFRSTHYVITDTFKNRYSRYMTVDQILNLQANGHEIGAHSQTHRSLTNMPAWEAEQEIRGSRNDLFDIGVSTVSSFSYPYGDYNETIKSLVERAGFTTGRSIIEGNNTKWTDPYLLMWRGPEEDASVPQMREWIDSAIAQNSWLILSFHQVDYSEDQFSTSPADFQAVVDYLKARKVRVVTVSEGYDILQNN